MLWSSFPVSTAAGVPFLDIRETRRGRRPLGVVNHSCPQAEQGVVRKVDCRRLVCIDFGVIDAHAVFIVPAGWTRMLRTATLPRRPGAEPAALRAPTSQGLQDRRWVVDHAQRLRGGEGEKLRPGGGVAV